MNTQAIAPISSLLRQASSLLLYQSVLEGTGSQAFLELLQVFSQTGIDVTRCSQVYGRWFYTLATHCQSWQDYLITQILKSENPFTRQVQYSQLENLSPSLIAAVRHDLQILQSLYNCKSEQISSWVQLAAGLSTAPVAWSHDAVWPKDEQSIREKFRAVSDWAEVIPELAAYYQQFGSGLFSEFRAFRWHSDQLVGISYPDPIRLDEIFGYEWQKAALLKNTEFLLAGYPALHVLLYGSRGSGKSSLVKALLHEYNDRGLRLIEVGKSALVNLPSIVDQLRDVPQKFIVFVDDLSFEEDDDAFKALKVVLEGNLTARPQNVVVYATSNRRHLIREFFEDRPRPSSSEEVHAWDTVQEKLSFSDRFGLTLTFEPADQTTYLAIVNHLAAQAGISLEQADLEYRALQWSTRHNGRSGRTARQFIDFLRADLALGSQNR